MGVFCFQIYRPLPQYLRTPLILYRNPDLCYTLTSGVFLLLAVVITLVTHPEPQKVSTPVFHPTPGSIAKRIPVTILCRTHEAEIFFTVDGSEPSRRSLRYDAPVPIPPGTTLKARAYLRGWTESKVQVGVYPPPTSTTTATAPETTPAGTTAPSR